MRKLSFVLAVLFLLAAVCIAQPKRRSRPPATQPSVTSAVDRGKTVGRTYTNKTFGFEITFPDTWLIPDDDFEAKMKKAGFDLGLKAPDSLPPASKLKLNQAIKNVNILLTAYRSMPGMADNAIVRISVEDLADNPQIRDAVDYFDAVRAMYVTLKLPADFKCSETQAEQLGAMQFAYLDTSSGAGKKRMYATVRGRHAIMFTLSYTTGDDLQTFRQILEHGNFALK